MGSEVNDLLKFASNEKRTVGRNSVCFLDVNDLTEKLNRLFKNLKFL